MPPETPNPYDAIVAAASGPRRTRPTAPHLDVLTDFAKENKLTVGSTTGGRHNRGSLHYSGNAIDIKGSGAFDDNTVKRLSESAAARGLRLRDERRHPKGQAVWGGAHIHIEYAGEQSPYDVIVQKASPPGPITSYDSVVAQASTKPRQPADISRVPGMSLMRQVRAASKAPQISKSDFKQADEALVKEMTTYHPSTNLPPTNVDLRVLKGEQPSNPLEYSRAQDVARRVEPERVETYAPPLPRGPNAFQRRKKSIGEHIGEFVEEYAPGLASTDTPGGLKTDALRSAINSLNVIPGPQAEILGAISKPREVLPEERLINPQADADKALSEFVGAQSTAVLPYTGAGRAAALIKNPLVRDAVMFGTVELGRQLAHKKVDPEALAESIVLGGAMGKIVGNDAGLMRRLVGYLGPQIALGIAKGEKPEQLIETAMTNALFAVYGGKREGQSEAINVRGDARSAVGIGRNETNQPETITSMGRNIPAQPNVGNIPSITTEWPRAELREGANVRTELSEDAGVIRAPESVNVQREGADLSEVGVTNPRHVDLQKRVKRGSNKGDFAKESRAETESRRAQVTPPAEPSAQGAAPQTASPADRVAFLKQKLADMGAAGATIENTPPERLANINDTRAELEKAQAASSNQQREEGDITPEQEAQHEAYRAERANPWNQTLGEYMKLNRRNPRRWGKNEFNALNVSHRREVERAAQQGKIGKGIEDYPDLVSKFGKSASPASGVPIPEAKAAARSIPETALSGIPRAGLEGPELAQSRTAAETIIPPSTTSARKAQLASDRAELDLPELPAPERKKWQQTLDEARQKSTSNASVLADEVLNKPRALNDVETAQLVLRAQEIKNRHADAMREIGDSQDTQTITQRRSEVEALEREFDKITTAIKKSGTEKGRALAAQKLTINQDYDLVSIIQRAKAAKGRELSANERAKYEKQASRIQELETQLLEAQSKAKTKIIQKDIDEMIRREGRGRIRKEKQQALDDEFASLRIELAQAKLETRSGVQGSGLAALDPEGKLTPIILKMARNRARSGIVQAERVIDEVFSAIKDHVQGITRDDVQEVLAGYNLQHDPLPAIKTRLRNQEVELTRQFTEKDYPAKTRPRKTPYDKEASDLKARVEQLKRKIDADTRGRDSILDTVLSLRKAGLLTGLRTHTRNIGGTGAFQGFEEVARVPGAVTDLVTSYFTGQRALGLPDPKAVAKSSYEAATKGVHEAVQIVKYGATAEDLAKLDRPREMNSGSRIIDAYANTVFRVLGAEDRVFRTYAYRRSIEEQAKLRSKSEGRAVKDLSENPTTEMVSQAILDAEVATFNNENPISPRLNVKNPIGKIAMDFILPFKRTPLNITARLLESNVITGVPKAIGELAWSKHVNKKISFAAQRRFSQTIGRSVTGSGLIVLGYLLAKHGLASGLSADDAGEREVNKAAGKSPMSIKIGKNWHQVGAFSPIGNLMAIGASLYSPRADESIVTRAPGTTGKVLLDQPFLQGVSSATDMLREPERRGAAFFGQAAGSFIPTAVSDIGATIDNTRREAKGVLARVQSRLPVLRSRLPEDKDVFGKPLESRRTAVFDPTLTTSGKDTEEPYQELLRLGVGVPKSPKIKDKDYQEPDDVYRQRLTKQGEAMLKKLQMVIRGSDYRHKSEDAKREALKDAVEDARREVNASFRGKRILRRAGQQGQATSSTQ